MFWFLTGFALAVPGAEQVPQHSGACLASSGWAQSLSSAVQGRCHTQDVGRVRPTRACTMCSHHACNHQVTSCATIIQLSCLGTTAAGFTGMPRQLPVPAGTSCTGPSRARALELKKQLLVVNSMDYSPKQLVSSAGLDATKTAMPQSPLSDCHMQGNSIMFPESQHGLECWEPQQGLFRLALLQACSAPPVFRLGCFCKQQRSVIYSMSCELRSATVPADGISVMIKYQLSQNI